MPARVPIHLASARLRAWAAAGGFERFARSILTTAENRITGRAIGRYMRDAGGEPLRRRADDHGPLRIVRGRLARSLRTGSREAVERVVVSGLRATLQKGSLVPYAAVHELGIGARSNVASRRAFGAIPARPYLGPAARDEAPAIATLAARRFAAVVARVMRGQGEGLTRAAT